MYEALAHYYDQIHASLTADIPFVLKLAQEQAGAVLELGCGTGRLLFPLAEAGFSVTGIDKSPQMLELARRRLSNEPPAVRGAVTLLETDVHVLVPEMFDTQFATALFTYNTLLHFRDTEVSKLIKLTAALLQPGGQIFIDVANPFLVANADYPEIPVLETSFFDKESSERIEQWSLTSLDTNSQTLWVKWFFKKGEKAEKPQIIELAYHYLYPHQLLLFLQQAGFRLEKMFGDYTGASFNEDSDRLLLLAKRSAQ